MKCKNMVDVSFASNRFKVQRKSQFFTVDENNKRSVRTEEQEQSMANNDPSNNTHITTLDIQYKDIKIQEVSRTNRI